MPETSRRQREHLYADPLVYDVLHRPGTAGEVRGLIRLAERSLERDGPFHWLEPASGTGRYLIELGRQGHSGLGLDLSDSMNAFARETAAAAGLAARVRFRTSRMERFTLSRAGPDARGRFDVAFCPINSLRHLHSDRAMLGHFAGVGRALRPGGVYLVGLEVMEPACAAPTEDVWTGRAKGLRVHQFVSYLPPEADSRREQVVSHLTISHARPPRVEHRDSRYALRTYTLAQWTGLVERAGWRVMATADADGRVTSPRAIGYQLWVLARAGH